MRYMPRPAEMLPSTVGASIARPAVPGDVFVLVPANSQHPTVWTANECPYGVVSVPVEVWFCHGILDYCPHSSSVKIRFRSAGF